MQAGVRSQVANSCFTRCLGHLGDLPGWLRTVGIPSCRSNRTPRRSSRRAADQSRGPERGDLHHVVAVERDVAELQPLHVATSRPADLCHRRRAKPRGLVVTVDARSRRPVDRGSAVPWSSSSTCRTTSAAWAACSSEQASTSRASRRSFEPIAGVRSTPPGRRACAVVYLKMAFSPDLKDAGFPDSPTWLKHIPMVSRARRQAPDGQPSRSWSATPGTRTSSRS